MSYSPYYFKLQWRATSPTVSYSIDLYVFTPQPSKADGVLATSSSRSEVKFSEILVNATTEEGSHLGFSH